VAALEILQFMEVSLGIIELNGGFSTIKGKRKELISIMVC